MAAKPIPDHHNAVCPYLLVSDVGALADFLKKTFGATELDRVALPDGMVAHATVKIADSIVMIGNPMGGPGSAAQMYCYVTDVDAVFARAIAAGALAVHEPKQAFYGDKIGTVKDAWGNTWAIATHVEDVSGEELARRMAGAAAS